MMFRMVNKITCLIVLISFLTSCSGSVFTLPDELIEHQQTGIHTVGFVETESGPKVVRAETKLVSKHSDNESVVLTFSSC